MKITVPFQEVKQNPLRFDGQVFVLTSPLCLSASACFAASAKHYGIGVLVGEETGGTTDVYGYCLDYRLPHSKLRLLTSWVHYIYPSNKGRCQVVTPNYEIEPSPKDYAKGVDSVFQYTLNLIKKNDEQSEKPLKLKIGDFGR